MRLLDILIGTLVVFPVLADAVWYDLPGLDSLELSDMGVPLLIAGLLVLMVRRLAREPLRLSAIADRGWKAARDWRDALERRPVLACRAVVGVLAALVLALALWWLWSERWLDADLAATAVWKLTHGTGAVVLVALVAAAVRRGSPEPWEQSFFIRLGASLARAWLAAIARSPARTLWGTTAVMAVFLFWVALLRHRAFETHGFDLGIFTNAIWNLTHGNGYVSSVKGGTNLLSDHQSPLFWLLAPLFRLAPWPETLLVVQALGLTAGGPALYYLGRAQFGREHWAPAALPWLYWTWLPLRNASAFDFHPEVFMLPLFLWAFVGFASGRGWARALGLLALVGAFGAKESAGVVAAGIGVAWALTGGIGPRQSRWLGVALAAAGVALFFFDVKVVPRFFGGDYAYMNLYTRFGGDIGSVILAPFTQPAYFLSQVMNLERLNFLFWTLAPLGFLPLFNWRAAAAAIPPYLMLFLSEGDQRVRIIFHYGIEPGAALFWALPLGLAAFSQRFGWRYSGIWMLFCCLAFLGPSELIRARGYLRTPHAQWLATEALPCLNKEAAMAASDVLIPHLASRPWISYLDLLEQRPSGGPVLCVVTDLDTRIDNWPLGKRGVEKVLASLPGQGYREAYRCGTFSVFELRSSRCLRCVPRCN
jgi:uncharacterized membrane protein